MAPLIPGLTGGLTGVVEPGQVSVELHETDGAHMRSNSKVTCTELSKSLTCLMYALVSKRQGVTENASVVATSISQDDESLS